MKESTSPHKKVQELCDCYAGTDPLTEMITLDPQESTEDAALKWIALAFLHGINSSAEKLTLTMNEAGEVTVKATYQKAQLPSPDKSIGKAVMQHIRKITHIEQSEGKTQLALGFRENSMELNIKIKKGSKEEKITIHFPDEP